MPVSKKTTTTTTKTSPVPYWKSECGRAVVYVGDCLDVMLQMDHDQFHAIVTDPPYGLEFMGKAWDAPWKNEGVIETCNEETSVSHPFRDGTQRVRYGNNRARKVEARQRRADELTDESKRRYIATSVEYVRDSHLYQKWFMERAKAMLRVAKPGAHLLSFGGTRMWHRMTCSIEDAGFDIRDTIMWVYGSGFPKSHNVSKAIDKMLGAEREVVGEWNMPGRSSRSGEKELYRLTNDSGNITTPTTEEAKQWSGFGTSLKPSYEPIVLARKPLVGSVAENTLAHGCGGLNIDECRVGSTGGTASAGQPNYLNNVYGNGMGGLDILDAGKGRWPANLIHDGSDEVVDLFPAQAGGGGADRERIPATDSGNALNLNTEGSTFANGVGHGDSGSAARFFYCAKADSDDRPHGKSAVGHPTVKPLDLMRYLVRLVCARGGVVLDPFMGSGSTGCAAIAEGMYFVGIEQSQEYADIAVGRLKLALKDAPVTDKLESGKVATKNKPPAQNVWE